LEQSRTGDLILFDRGYPAFWLYALLASKQRAFCMRAKTGLDLNIKAFLQSGQRQALVTFTPNRLAEEACRIRQDFHAKQVAHNLTALRAARGNDPAAYSRLTGAMCAKHQGVSSGSTLHAQGQ
jgi:hypothetical protein